MLGARTAQAQTDQGPVARVAVGAQHACALKTDGAVFCWGDNTGGSLGLGLTEDRVTAPRELTGLR